MQNRLAVLESENKRLRKKFNDVDREMKMKMSEDAQSIEEYVKKIQLLEKEKENLSLDVTKYEKQIEDDLDTKT